MKTSPAVAKTYAKALFELARERNQAEQIKTELARAAQALVGDGQAAEALSRPWISPAVRRRVADDIAARLELSRLSRDFLALLAGQGRVDHVGAIASVFRDMLDADWGRVRARVRTAVALTEADRGALATRLGRALGGKQVMIDEVVDSTLLGGFVAEIGSLIVDGSLNGQLARMRERLVKG